jgi:hypothetical protein
VSPDTTAPPADESRRDRKRRLRAEKEAKERAALEAKMERYRVLRANVRRRRGFYVLFILLALAVLVATAWDMVFNASDLKWYLLSGYVVLFILAILLLISRRRQLEDINEIKALERSWLECDNCHEVFQFGSESFLSRRRVGFTCPVCGDESALPLPGAEPVERPLPSGQLSEVNYLCGSCKEDIVLGTYGTTPRDVEFRACPKCGIKGQIIVNMTI